MKTIKEAFDYYDEGNKGYLTTHELKCCVIYLTGIKLSKLSIRRLKEKASKFTLADISAIVTSQIRDDPGTEIFNALDVEKKGFLTLHDFNSLCDVHAKHMKPNVRDSIFREVDSNQDGMVTLRDIQRLARFNV